MIKLTKNSIIHTNDYNPQSDKYVRKEVPRLWPYLDEKVKLGDDFTLEDLFYHIEREKYVFNLIFDLCLGHFPLQLFIDDIKKPNPEVDNEIDYLEIRRYGERQDWGDIDLFIDFGGVSVKEDIGYAIEFSPLNELRHLPLRLNEEFSISEIKCPSRAVQFLINFLKKIHVPLKRWDNPFSYVYVKGTTCFSVYELISTVLSEISFAGDPEMRDKKIVEIVGDVDEMKQELSNG